MIEKVFGPEIKLEPIEISYNKTANDDPAALELNTDNIGKYPYVYYKGLNIEYTEILEFKLTNEQFLPRLYITFTDKSNKMIDENFPLDNEIISLFLKPVDSYNNIIRLDFKILSFIPNKLKGGEKNKMVFDLEGILNINYLYYSNQVSYTKTTSYSVLYNIAQAAGLGFASNISNTNDAMTWINPNQQFYAFMQDVIMHSYLSDDTFLYGYVDYYNMLNYVDIEKQLNADISKQTCVTNDEYFSKNKKRVFVPLILSNHPDYNTQSRNMLYIDRYKIINESTKTNLLITGYRSVVNFYDKTYDKYNTTLLDTLSTVGDGTQIIMKEQPNNNKNDIFKNVIGNYYLNKMDRDNVHGNYLYAYQQNSNNLYFLQKIKMVIHLKTPNYAIYRFQKVLVEIFKLSELDSDNDQSKYPANTKEGAKSDNSKINQRLSGEWLIIGINFLFSKEYGLVQEVILTKRELSAKYTPKN